MFNDDDDNEDGRRDWLDWVHTFLRATVMLSIMYFYSSTVRILMIGLLGFLIYLYQAGWFLLRTVPRGLFYNYFDTVFMTFLSPTLHIQFYIPCFNIFS